MSYSQIRTHSATTCIRNRSVVLTQRKSTYRVENPNRKTICKTRIDGGYIVNAPGPCCDYLVANLLDKDAYFVELKGSHVRHAVRQIVDTLGVLKPCLAGHSCFARIVPTRANAPDIRNDPTIVSARKLFRDLGGDLKIKATIMVETY